MTFQQLFALTVLIQVLLKSILAVLKVIQLKYLREKESELEELSFSQKFLIAMNENRFDVIFHINVFIIAITLLIK